MLVQPQCSSTADYYKACISILVAVLITVVDVGIEKPIGSGSIEVFKSLGFAPAFLAVTNISSAFCKTPYGTPTNIPDL